MSRPTAANAGSASTAMSTTASPRTEAGHSAAASTEVRRNSSASRMPTSDSTGFKAVSRTSRFCLSEIYLQLAFGRQESRKSKKKIRF